MQGLNSKLILPDLQNIISQYNLVCLCETFCLSEDYEDQLNDLKWIPRYKLIHTPRSSFKRPSGGIAIAIRKYITNYVTFIPNDCEHLLWCKIDRCILGLDEDLYLASVYVPPENSNYVNVSCFEEIENEIIQFNNKSKYVIVAGDLNAHTSTKPDVIIDSFNDEHLPDMPHDLSLINSTTSTLE